MLEGVYVLGSSYSWDALPPALDNEPDWQIYCSKSLDYIFQNPRGNCGAFTAHWPEVLDPPAVPFAYISFQPVPVQGSTQAQDVAHIGTWLEGQPVGTVAVLHMTWPPPDRWEVRYHAANADHTLTNASVDYGYVLATRLRALHPGREFVLTRSNEMMDYILHDPESPIFFEALFRDDAGHMSYDIGRYLQHNALRQAMGQETGVDSTVDGVDADIRDYLDAVVELHPAW